MEPAPEAPADALPRQIGRYHVLGRLADGGMAELFLGKLIGPSGFERPVAIKRILPHLARDPEFVAMFIDEARLAAGIRHPNVVQVEELGQAKGELFLVMEFLSGETVGGLMQRVAAMGPLDPEIAIHIVAEAAAGLQAAHELTGADGTPLGLVHRDISPENLFVTYEGAIKVLDFGVAMAAGRIARTQTGNRKGKFSYMAPEQIRGEALDARADVFALGIVLFEISTGKRLFKRSNDLLIMKAICESPIPSPADVVRGYPAALARVCERALARDPAARYASARELRRALHAALPRARGDGEGEEELRHLMQRTFPDRIAQKQQLLRDVVAGAPIAQVPIADLGPSGWSETYDISAKGARSGRMRWIALAIAIAALAAALGSTRWPSAPRPPTTMRTTPQPKGATELPAPPQPSTETVSIRIDSTPPGAQVSIAGLPRGSTPLELSLARTATASSLELRLEGYVVLHDQLVPDAVQRLQFALVSLPSARSTKPTRPVRRTPEPMPKQQGFHRFE